MLTVITGPPGSGKTTYARQHAAPGDIIIDFDVLAAALTLPGKDEHDYPACIAPVARAAWMAALTEALKASCQGRQVWLVHAYPPPVARRNYHRHAATFIPLGTQDGQAAAHPSRPPAFTRW